MKRVTRVTWGTMGNKVPWVTSVNKGDLGDYGD